MGPPTAGVLRRPSDAKLPLLCGSWIWRSPTGSRRSAATPQRKGAGEAGRMARLTQAAIAAQSPEVSNRQAEAAPFASGCDLQGDETGWEPGRFGLGIGTSHCSILVCI